MKSRKELLKLAEENGWDYISAFQKLSEDFIRKFKNKVDWIGMEFQNIKNYLKIS